MELAEEEQITIGAVEFDVGDAVAEDLLKEGEMVSHYSMAVGEDVDLTTSDQHFAAASIKDASGSTLQGFDRLEVPTSDAEAPIELTLPSGKNVNLNRMKKADLVALANQLGFDTTGTKEDIVARMK
jgi:hypothetical protein